MRSPTDRWTVPVSTKAVSSPLWTSGLDMREPGARAKIPGSISRFRAGMSSSNRTPRSPVGTLRRREGLPIRTSLLSGSANRSAVGSSKRVDHLRSRDKEMSLRPDSTSRTNETERSARLATSACEMPAARRAARSLDPMMCVLCGSRSAGRESSSPYRYANSRGVAVTGSGRVRYGGGLRIHVVHGGTRLPAFPTSPSASCQSI